MNNNDIEKDKQHLQNLSEDALKCEDDEIVEIDAYAVGAIARILKYTKQLEAKANKYDRLVERIKENLDKRKQKYNEILNDYGNIDTDVIFNIPNANVRKRLDELSFEIVILQELIEEE